MAEGQLVYHDGCVVEKDMAHVYVRIESNTACNSCQVKGVCSAGSSKEKVIKAATSQFFEIGDRARIVLEEKLAWLAILFAYIFPFLLVVAVLFTTYALSGSQTVSALVSLGSLVPYFLSFSLFKGKLEKRFHFRAERLLP